jgi:hypothetical protein
MKNVECKRKVCWPLFILVAALCALFPARSFGQSSNRWLLIFETTSSMRHRTNGVLAETEDLLNTGMHGLIHPGDTIGIWTFNDRLYTGEAPLQIWSPEAAPKIIRHTLQFLSAQQYARSPRMEEMLTNMVNIVQSSPFITVIWFTDGDNPIKGTPFDSQINEVYKASYRQQKKASMPIMTVLRGVAGEITTNTVNMAPWPVAIPPVPPPPPSARAKPSAAATKPSPPAVPPLIYIGKPQSAPPPQSGEENNATPVAPSNSNETNGAGPRSEAPAAPGASAPSELPVASTPTPTVEPTASAPTVVAQAPAGEQVSDVQRSVGDAPNPDGTAPNNSNTQPAPRANAAAAASAPPEELFSGRNIAIASVAFAAIVCGLLLMAARRARASQASLITRSLDRERK